MENEESIAESESAEKINKTEIKKRGKYYASYTEDDLQTAIDDVRNNKTTIYSAAKRFKIPFQSLSNRIKEKSSSNHGKSTVLSADLEKELCEWILHCAKIGFPRTKDELLNAAAELALLSPNENNNFKNVLPTSSWVKAFMQRHPQLSFRTPSTVTKAAANVTSSDILNFFNTIVSWLKDENLLEVFQNPKQVGNGDESGFALNPAQAKILAGTGSKQVYRRATANPKEQVSVMYNFLASGDVLPPQLILKKSVNSVAVAYSAGGESLHFISVLTRSDTFFPTVLDLCLD